MCRHATFALPAEPGSASAARAAMRWCFVDWQLEALVGDMEVAVTELVTNALRHARTPLEVSLSSESRMVEAAVFDGSPVFPTPRPRRVDLDADIAEALAVERELGLVLEDNDPRWDVGAAGPVTGGRGLLLVAALAAEWGVSPLSDGKAVWVRTPVPADWPHGGSCPCPTSAEAIPLASGRRVLHTR